MNGKWHRISLCTLIVALLGAQEVRSQGDADAIEQALSKAHKVVKASWWGFDETEATKALQFAIDSGADKVIVENMGKPWIVDKIHLASNQEVFFEKGVVILAKKGAFKGKTDSLFSAALKENVTLTGYGAELRMRKADYHTDAYAKAEWRHCLNIRSCTNVSVYGLTLAESGGDGIYLGVAKRGVTNKNVHIKDVVCDGNNRQGISVISVEDLLIENTVLKNTWGTAPQAGIDFEPNLSDEKIVNCVMRNCVSANNKGCAYVLYLTPLNGASSDVSVRIENCVSRGANAISARVATSNGGPQGPVKGLIELVGCTFEDTGNAGVSIGDVPATGCRVRFENCTIADASSKPTRTSPIEFSAGRGCANDVGGVEFVNCTVKETTDRPLMTFRDYSGGLKVLGVTGTINLLRRGQRREVIITEELLDKLMPSRTLKRIARFNDYGMRYVPVFPDGELPKTKPPLVRLRVHAEYLVYAERGQEVKLNVQHLQVGRYSGKSMPIRIISPSGEQIGVKEAPFKESAALSFVAPETGTFRLVCEPGSNCVHIDSPTHRLCIFGAKGPINFIATSGDFYFYVPAATKELGVKVFGAGGERVKATVFDLAGRKVWEKDDIDMPQMFVKERGDGAKDEVWRLRLDRPSHGFFEDHYVDILGAPSVLACSKESLLKPVK